MLPIQAYKQLTSLDFKLLRSIEVGMRSFKYVPIDVISRKARVRVELASKILSKLCSLGLLMRRLVSYEGYTLTYWGYDCLALKALVDSDFIVGIGKPLGIGKEADVYEGFTPVNERVAVKFHRLGRISFRKTRRFRSYLEGKDNLPWMFQAKIAAKNEYKVLEHLYSIGVKVPKPYTYNRHVVVMSFIYGDPLYVCDYLPNPISFYESILTEVRKTYRIGGFVHGDLSEYNVIVSEDFLPLIIDWPQAVSIYHPSAERLLKRDIFNIVMFFNRRFGLKLKFKDAFSFIVGAS